MSVAHLVYPPADNDAALPLALSIFADRAHVRDQLREDGEAAGFRIARVAEVADLLEGEALPLGEIVLLDCPAITGARLAALARLDLRAAHCGAHLIVSTSAAALDDVFACLDQSNPEILVDPSRADRVIALGRALARAPDSRVRDLSEEDRLMLLRLTEQVGQIAQRLDRLAPSTGHGSSEVGDGGLRFASPNSRYRGGDLPLPDPRLVRNIIRQRQLRARFFDADLFADPAWDILLDLTAAQAERTRVSVTSLCIASGVPATTALRWISQMVEAGLLERREDEMDRRRAFIALTDTAAHGMARYFAELGSGARVI